MLSRLRSSSFTRFIMRNSFRKEMVSIILIKLIALFLLWGLFFSHPHPEQREKNAFIHHFLY